MRPAPLVALTLLACLPAALAAVDEAPPTLSPDTPTHTWRGATFTLATTPLPEACAVMPCDALRFVVEIPPETPVPWPGLDARIEWLSPADDFDIYLYDEWGFLVVATWESGPTSEALRVPEMKPQEYTFVVVPVLVMHGAYDGALALGTSGALSIA